jgi:shikimate dehydrogenase
MISPIRGAVIGSPVEHSLSPLLHREAFSFLGIEGSYQRQDVPSETLAEFFRANADKYDYLSITMPLKEEALTLPVEIDPLVSRIQSSNTLYQRGGQWHLTSTDGSGLISALQFKGYERFQRALVLGAGGTARAVVGALDGVADEIVVLGRTSTRREVLQSAVEVSHFEYQRWSENPGFAQYDLVVNTTPAGAADLLADSLLPGDCQLLFDVIYTPWPTVLASRWSDLGGEVINGSELLLYQGIEQLSLVLDREIDRIALASHLRPLLAQALR